MNNSFTSIKNKITEKYISSDKSLFDAKSTNINILLNRVRLDKKKESRKKILFTAFASFGLVLFGVLIF